MSLRSSGAPAAEERRRRVVLEIDDELPVARGLAARGGELAVEAAAVGGKIGELSDRRIAGDQRPPQHRGLGFEAPDDPRALGDGAVGGVRRAPAPAAARMRQRSRRHRWRRRLPARGRAASPPDPSSRLRCTRPAAKPIASATARATSTARIDTAVVGASGRMGAGGRRAARRASGPGARGALSRKPAGAVARSPRLLESNVQFSPPPMSDPNDRPIGPRRSGNRTRPEVAGAAAKRGPGRRRGRSRRAASGSARFRSRC